MSPRNADPIGELRNLIKTLGEARNPPVPTVGIYNASEKTVTLDTGQVVYNPLVLISYPEDGETVFCIYYQGGHAVAIIPTYNVVVEG